MIVSDEPEKPHIVCERAYWVIYKTRGNPMILGLASSFARVGRVWPAVVAAWPAAKGRAEAPPRAAPPSEPGER